MNTAAATARRRRVLAAAFVAAFALSQALLWYAYYGAGAKAKRVEVRFPDAMANPYLAYAALFMAGLDGIQNRLHPGDAMDKNLYDLPPAELANVQTVCGSLREALDSLEADHDFLLKGDVFSKDQIDAYIEIKRADVARFEMTPSPVEFDMYYSA